MELLLAEEISELEFISTSLPHSSHRDDALLLWKVISNFVHDVLSIYYKSDGDVRGDDELKAWVQDIHQNGFPERPGDVDHEFPASVKTRDQLVHLITCVLFNCSCQNAAVSGHTFDVCAFIPNTPPLMRQPPPTQKGMATLELVMKTLPDKSQAKHHVAAISGLSSGFPKKVRLELRDPDFPSNLINVAHQRQRI